ncbi:hypothetical protein Fmac_008514 [Flemingia macrophylla]|uniref:Uncharacterized protein n=1 Tax=Flemingia macrophylla TaxID=520843 RepID=A0ABD1MXQ0_9FABA
MLKIAAILDEARSFYATHNRKLKELSLLRSKSPSPSHFFSAFSKTLTPLFDFHRRLASTDRVVSFVSTFAAAADDEFLDHFLKFLLAAAAASNKTARYRACQIVVIVDDSRPIYGRVAGCFMNKFSPRDIHTVQHYQCYQLRSSSDNLKILVKDVTRNRNLSNNELSMTVGDVFAGLSHLSTLLIGPLSVLVGLPLDTLYDGNSFENAPASLPPALTSPPPSGSHHSHHHSGSSSHNKTQASDNENLDDHKVFVVRAVVGIVLGSVLVAAIVLLALVFYKK